MNNRIYIRDFPEKKILKKHTDNVSKYMKDATIIKMKKDKIL